MDLGDELVWREGAVGADEIDEAGFAKFVAGSVVGFGDAVGIDDEKIAGRERKFLRDACPVGGHADHRGSGMEALDGAVDAEKERGVVTAIGILEQAGNVVVDGEEESGVAVVGSAVKEKLVDGVEEAREIVESNGVAAAKIGLKISHQQSASNSLPGNVGENKSEARGTEIEEIEIVAANLAGLHAGSGVIESAERRTDLREKARLDVAGNVHFMSGATFGFHAIGDVLREANIFESDGGLPRDGIKQALVFTGIRLLGKRLAEHEEPDKMGAMADEGHETFRRESGKRKFLRDVDGTGRGNIPSPASSGEIDKEPRIHRKCGEFGRNRATSGDQGVVVSAEIEGQCLRMQRLSEMVVEEGSEFVAVGDGAGLVGKILKDEARVVGGAKEGSIDALRAAFDDRAGDPNESDAKESAESHTELRVTTKKLEKKRAKKKMARMAPRKRRML